MSIKITGIYKSYQPGDVASFDAAESRHIVASGLGRVHTVDQPHEAAIETLHTTLPVATLLPDAAGHATLGVPHRPSIAEPGTAMAAGLPGAMTPATALNSRVADSVAGAPALERASATPMPGTLGTRGQSPAVDVAARGDPYVAATRATEAARHDVGDGDLAAVAGMKSGETAEADGKAADGAKLADAKPADGKAAAKPDIKPDDGKASDAKPDDGKSSDVKR